MLKLGVIGSSLKENEHRVPIHPDHLSRIPPGLREYIFFEDGYGRRFGISDAELTSKCGGTAKRTDILSSSDIVLLAKPVLGDFQQIRRSSVLGGWAHCVQQRAVTQAAIDTRFTIMAFEAMFAWTPSGDRDMHVFYRNNEIAGYCAVLHALALAGIDGYYGHHRRVVVLSFGSVSRGAIHALKGRGFNDITVYTRRPIHLVHDRILGCRYAQLSRASHDGPGLTASYEDGHARPLIDALAEADIIINGILQDTDNPTMYMDDTDLGP